MSQEPTTADLVELGDRFLEAVNRRDFDAVMCLFAADAVLDMSTGGLGPYEGAAAIREFLSEWTGAYEEIEGTAEEILVFDNGVTFSVIVQKGRPVGSSG